MSFPQTRKYKTSLQYILCITLVVIAGVICFIFFGNEHYTMVALILLMVVSLAAMLFDILPVLAASVLSALVWNFFFIPPLFNFHIYSYEDGLMFSLYFAIALINGVLTFNIRKAEKKAAEKEEQEHSIRLYNTLLNSLSHELRTPISTIIGAVDTLKDDVLLNDEHKVILLNEIDAAGMRLNRQVENLLNMSRLDSGTFKPRPDWSDIREIINNIINKFELIERSRIIVGQNNSAPLFKVDSGLLEQIINNLLHNALIYTDKDKKIYVDFEFKNEALFITVADEGRGFDKDQINKVFNKFYRLDQSRTGGIGLGLSIVKGFTEAMNGSIHLENNNSGGATFTVEIPAEVSYLNNLKNE